MKCTSLCALLMAGTALAFHPSPAFTATKRVASSTTPTVLYISSWGTKGPPSRWAESTEKLNPEQHIQAYLSAPDAVEARSNIDGTVMVSGLVKSQERTDQTIFDLLNHEESAFEFSKIVAFVDDVKFAKKRLLSRSARYTGLLDKLDFTEATTPGALPTVDQLTGVKSWVAILEGTASTDLLDGVKQVAAIAKEASTVENVAILLVGAVGLDVAACQDAIEALKMDGQKQYSLVAVGTLKDHAEGRVPYQYKVFGTPEGVLPSDAIFSRDEAMRMITECLQLEVGVNKAWSFSEVTDVNATEYKLVKGLREAGYARPQEIDHMLRIGPEVRNG